MVARKKESPIFYLIGVPANFNLWGERSTSKYLLLKRGFSTYTRIVPARESPYFLCAMRQSLRVTSPNPTSWVRAVCAGCAMRGVRGARCARESLAGRDMRAYGAEKAAEPPTAQQTTPKSRSGISSKTTSRVRFLTTRVRLFRFASVAKQFPKKADELFLATAQENAQWRYKSYL